MAAPRTVLDALLDDRRWTNEDMLREFEATARAMGESATLSLAQLKRWLRGDTPLPRPSACRVLERMFGHPAPSLLTPLGSAGPAGVADGVTGPVGALRFSIDTARITGSHAIAPGRLVDMAARRALRFLASAEGNILGPQTLAELHSEVARLAAAYPREPLASLLGDLADTQDFVFRVLEGRRGRPTEVRDLYLLAGVTCGMLAKASHDIGDSRSALTQTRTAYVCADNADHNGLRAWVLGLQSLISYWAGWAEDARRYAGLGTATAAGVTGTSVAWLAALEARASAALGDAEATRTALSRAEAAREQLVADDLDALGGIMTFPRPRQLYYSVDAMVALPEPPPELPERAEDAVAAYQTASPEEWAFSDEAGARTDLALAWLGRGELDGACEALRPVLDLPHDRRIRGVIVSTERIHTALCVSDWVRVPAAKSIRDEIEAFTRTPAKALLR